MSEREVVLKRGESLIGERLTRETKECELFLVKFANLGGRRPGVSFSAGPDLASTFETITETKKVSIKVIGETKRERNKLPCEHPTASTPGRAVQSVPQAPQFSKLDYYKTTELRELRGTGNRLSRERDIRKCQCIRIPFHRQQRKLVRWQRCREIGGRGCDEHGRDRKERQRLHIAGWTRCR